jgi:glutamine synthetase
MKVFDNFKEKGIQKIKLAITDIDGILRGKVVSLEKFKGIAEKGFGFCDVIFGWDAGDMAYDNAQFTGWHTGYPDAQAKIDLVPKEKYPGKMTFLFSWPILMWKAVLLLKCVRAPC